MKTLERLIRYCKVDTQSDPKTDTIPSTKKQFDLAYMLEAELKDLGVADVRVSEDCFVYARIPGNVEGAPKIGFIAHMDTAPDYCATGVDPQVIENYDGEDITLKCGKVIEVAKYPELKRGKGKTLLVSTGETLLGADDKAGIAAIMGAVEYIMAHPEFRHGDVGISFSPDEEVGRGISQFDIKGFDCDFAYTLDGGQVNCYSDETFNAASAEVCFQGASIHPGSAKNKMINASNVAHYYHGLLPVTMRPEHTEGREGFFHLHDMKGNCDYAQLDYIIRNHDKQIFEHQLVMLQEAADYVNKQYGEVCTVNIRRAYCNMKEILDQHPQVVELAVEGLKAIGLEPVSELVRGGTDGSFLTLNGLPCPNLGTGGGNYHGPYEYCIMEETEQAVELIIKMLELAGDGK
ncbi:MAG: peptidase T [Erysipelotrichaceae bacterium]|nr:peptidase T [Erysipelotrichaceae bacterium]